MKSKRVRVGFLITDDSRMKIYNQRLLGKAKATDVISMPVNDVLSDSEEMLGELIVDCQEVTRNARRFRVPYKHELARVVAHGVLHLMGMGDETPKARSAMKAIEDQIVSELQ